MHECRVWLQPDLVARVELMTFAEYGDDLLAAKLGEHLRFRTGRLDHDDLGFGAVIGDGEMFGTDAVDCRTPFRIGRCRLLRQLAAFGPFKPGSAVRLHLALEEVHRRRADKA